MRLLLDTHIWLWGVLEPERLAKSVARKLAAPDSELYLSPISVWETMLLLERGRLGVAGEARGWVERTLRASPMHDAPFTREVAIESRLLTLPHGDPADRFLAASARVHGLTLVTADDRLLHSTQFAVLPNR